MRKMVLTLGTACLVAMLIGGCGSSRESDGTIAGQGTTLADAEKVGISNCLTCHNSATEVTDGWLKSRHGNNLIDTEKEALNSQTFNSATLPAHVNDPAPDYEDPDYEDDPECQECHDQLGDGRSIDEALAGENERPIVSCESCHGGGQFHNGIAIGIPFPTPGPDQCGQCHGVTSELSHDTEPSGNNVRYNISDSHNDDPATGFGEIIEGYVVKTGEQTGCGDCHYSAHNFDLTINNQWANSKHAGEIKTNKDKVLQDSGLSGADLLTAVKAEGVTSATGDGWVHYDWDDSKGNGPGERDRTSCQRCHTSTGLKNFLADTANYNDDANDFSHLDGWAGNFWSGENEMLYCWGCHSDSKGSLRDDPNGLTLDFESLVGPAQDPSGDREFVVLPDKGDSNVCAACHSGRGNNISIRDRYADAAAETDPADRGLSSRFAGHHAPTAGSVYTAVTHTGFEFVGLNYNTPLLEHDLIDEEEDGPCVSCHMGGPDDPNHTFESVTEDGAGDISAISNQALCDTCHTGDPPLVSPTSLNTLRAEFDDARQILLDLVDNIETNYLELDISASANRNTDTLALNDYGAFQNSLYATEEPCLYVHNSLYGKRLIFDSIDWLEDGALDGTIADYGAANTWLGGTTRP